MADGSFLLNDWDFDYSGLSASQMGMRAMDDSSPFVPGGGDGTNYYALTNSFVQPDYVAQIYGLLKPTVGASYLTGIGSNTISDVEYEIQSRTNLLQSDWQFEGAIYGSEVTNWTVLSVFQNNRTNLFIRLKSDLSGDGSGLPDWWEKEYFATNNIDPYGNPMGDGYDNYYKYQHGMNPNSFYTPVAPQGLTANLNQAMQTATV